MTECPKFKFYFIFHFNNFKMIFRALILESKNFLQFYRSKDENCEMTFSSQINLLLHPHTEMMMTSSPHFSYFFHSFFLFSSWFRSLFVLSIHLTLIKTHHERVELNWTEMQSDKTNSIPHRRPSILFLFLLLYAMAIHTEKERIYQSWSWMMTDRACIIGSHTFIYIEMKWKMWPHYASAFEEGDSKNISECHTRMKSIIIASRKELSLIFMWWKKLYEHILI